MKSVIIFISCTLITGCAYISEDTDLKGSSDEWKISDPYHQTYMTYQCDTESTVTLTSNKKLSKDGKVYLLFFVIPISSADIFDIEYTGLTINATYTNRVDACSAEDISIDMGGPIFFPEVAETDAPTKLACSYIFDIPIQKSGRFTLKLKEINHCKAPSVDFEYKTKTKYNYDGISG